MLLASTLAAVVAHAGIADRPAPDADHGAPLAERSCTASPSVSGPDGAAVLLRLYLDPTAGIPLRTWLELEQLVAERSPDVRLELVVVLPPHERSFARRNVIEDRVRAFVVAAAAATRTADVLRVVARDGWRYVHAQLLQPEGRARLAAALEVPAERLDTELADRSCIDAAIREATDMLAELERDLLGTTVRLPAIGVAARSGHEALLPADARPAELRTQIDRALRARASGRDESFVDDDRPVDRFSAPLAEFGLQIGGPGLPHRVIVLADGEGVSVLNQRVPVLLAFIKAHPGVMSLQVAATGSSSEAKTLARRLCAAQKAGLDVDYLHYALLATNQRPTVPAWLAALDETANDAPCSNVSTLSTHPTTAESLSPGLWIDGEPIARTATQHLERLAADSPAPPLWLFLPPAAASP